MSACRCINCITPPHLLRKLLESNNKEVRDAALSTLLGTAELRGERLVRATLGLSAASAPSNGRRSIFDLRHSTRLTDGRLVRTEQGAATADPSVNRAFDGLGLTRDFYNQELGRNSIDDHGMRLDGYVHRGRDYNNAFWNGQVMVFGDGDGVIFTDFTASLDVIAHELTHGVTEHTAGLEYHLQSGALNESMSDVFGSLVKQWHLGQTAAQADWLIGAEVFTPGIGADALRSMKAPGTAYNNPDMGRDPQPDHMSRFVALPDSEDGDWGGVHINSGIPNKAFYLVAAAIGGNAWEEAGHIWYEALKASTQTTNFQQFADTTNAKATQLYGAGGVEQLAVQEAWRAVGIKVAGAGKSPGVPKQPNWEEESFAELTRRIDELAQSVTALSSDVSALKNKGNGHDARAAGRSSPRTARTISPDH
jgi:Zn-dependent metalloprotease